MLNLDKVGITLKIIFDGYDFIQSDIGKMLVTENKIPHIIRTTFLPTLYEGVEEFLAYCKYNGDGYLPNKLMEKYHCGLYSLDSVFDNNNPWKDKSYVLFNPSIISQLKKNIELDDIKFWVCPAYNEIGQVEAIGFRVVDINTVRKCFKWIFTCGNNIIYGKEHIDKNKTVYVVEGFRDYIALKECGYNVIGLGSVFISEKQKQYIDTLDPIILLDNDKFGIQKSLQYSEFYKTAILTGTEHKDAYDAFINGDEIKICQIQ